MGEKERTITVELTEKQGSVLLEALEFRFDPDPEHPDYRTGLDIGVKVTRELEDRYLRTGRYEGAVQ